MKVLITGSQGYIGNALVTKLGNKHELTLVDNGFREEWVKESKGCSLTRFVYDKPSFITYLRGY